MSCHVAHRTGAASSPPPLRAVSTHTAAGAIPPACAPPRPSTSQVLVLMDNLTKRVEDHFGINLQFLRILKMVMWLSELWPRGCATAGSPRHECPIPALHGRPARWHHTRPRFDWRLCLARSVLDPFARLCVVLLGFHQYADGLRDFVVAGKCPAVAWVAQVFSG